MRLIVLAGLACVHGVAPRLAQAQPAAAEALFRAGREAVERGDHATACAKFRESYRLETAVGTLMNIAMCEEQLGELSGAWAHFQEALHGLPNEDRRFEIIATRLRELDARLPRLTIALSPQAPRDTRVAVGALELTGASFNVALPYDPGRYEVVVSAPGRAARTYAVQLAERQSGQLEVEPGPPEQALPASPAAPAPPALPAHAMPAATSSTTQRSIGWALVGAASVSVIAAAIAGGFVIDRASTVSERCPDDVCDDQGELAAESGRAAYVVLIAAGATALVSSSVGIYLLLDEGPSHTLAGAGFSARF